MKNIFNKALLITGLCLLAAWSCNRYLTPNSPEDIEDRRTTRESKYNLMGYQGDREVITGDVPAVDDTSKEESDYVELPEYSPGDNHVSEIFAVQVFASKSNEEAIRFQQSIAPLFDETTSTDYKAPYYKVRIGNCRNLEEAEALLEKVRGFGYRNAWIVRERLQ